MAAANASASTLSPRDASRSTSLEDPMLILSFVSLIVCRSKSHKEHKQQTLVRTTGLAFAAAQARFDLQLVVKLD